MENKFQKRFNFNNIGTKIKNLAKWYCWVSIILIWVASAICIIGGLGDDDTLFISLIGIVSAIIMPFVIWISCWFMYAFGELVEKATAIERNTRGETQKSQAQTEADDARRAKLDDLRSKGLITEEEYQQALNKQ